MSHDVVPCWYCNFEHRLDFGSIAQFGQELVCAACDRSFYVMHPDSCYKENFPPHIARYILHRKRNRHPDHLETDIQHLQFFEQTLATAKESLSGITHTSVRTFSTQFLNQEKAVRFEHNLFDLLQLMLLNKELSYNPLATSAKPVIPSQPPSPETLSDSRNGRIVAKLHPPRYNTEPLPSNHYSFSIRKLGLFFGAPILLVLSLSYFNIYSPWLPQQTKEEKSPKEGNIIHRAKTTTSKPSRQRHFLENNLSSYFNSQNNNKKNSNLTKINPLIPTWDSLEKGRLLFNKHCNDCHQSSLDRQILSRSGDGILYRDTYLFWTIAEGGQPFDTTMPAFKAILADDEIWTLILFLETLS